MTSPEQPQVADQFVHLHNHTCYSLLDGISAIPELVAHAKELRMDTMAITDHGNLYGAIEFYQECRSNDIKPIIGCELYVAAGATVDDHIPEDRNSTHLVALAADQEGYSNLLRVVTKANTDGYYRYPRVDHEILREHSNGLMILSGCASSELSKLISDGDTVGAETLARKYADMFPNRYWLELQSHTGVPNLDKINAGLLALAERLELPLVGTNDCHYIKTEQSRTQDLKICIQTGSTIDEAGRLRMTDDGYYLKSGDEMMMLDIFQNCPQALLNTRSLADQCLLELEFGRTRMPPPRIPEGENADEYLERLCREGFPKRYPDERRDAVERLEHELDVVRKTGFAPYFLAVKEITDEARRKNIRFGVRGSAAASIALYCLDITGIDPLQYGLVFERFLNIERKEMPDIDMDFPDEARQEMATFVAKRYGDDRVAKIVGFTELRTRSAVRDAGRAMGIPLNQVDTAARLIPRKSATLEAAMAQSTQLQKYCRENVQIDELIKRASELVGIKRSVNKHPAGILISDEPIINVSPLERSNAKGDNHELLTTQYNMDQVAQLGLIKMDFLGLTSLTILDEAEHLIRADGNPDFVLENLPIDNEATYRLIATGNTTNVFQLESDGMQQYLRELEPKDLNEIAAMTALYRPGPMEHIDQFIDGKYGRVEVTYPHPSMAHTLDETYGVIVYQDQVLKIMQDFAGYSLGKADVVRKAMGKKIPALMRTERQNFVNGAISQGHDMPTANRVFDLIEPFAGYAFNKAHAISYAMLAYWTAYCKANHPVEYLTAALNARRNNTEVYTKTLTEIDRMGLKLALPDATSGKPSCDVIIDAEGKKNIRLGLGHVKGVGRGRVEKFANNRESDKEPWNTVEAAFASAAVNELGQSATQSLAKAGAFDSLAPRSAILDSIEALWQLSQRAKSKRSPTLQQSLLPEPEPALERFINQETPEYDAKDLRVLEEQTLGVAITPPDSADDVIDLAAIATRGHGFNSLAELKQQPPGNQVDAYGRLSRLREGNTKQGKPYRRINLTLNDGELEVMVWAELITQSPDEAWEQGAALCVSGELQERRDAWSMSCRRLTVIDAAHKAPTPGPGSAGPGQELRFEIILSGDSEKDLKRMRRAIRTAIHFPGDDRLVCVLRHSDGKTETIEIGAVRTQARNPICTEAVYAAAKAVD